MVNARHAVSVRPCRSASRYWIDGCLHQLRVQQENYDPQNASFCEVNSLSYFELAEGRYIQLHAMQIS